jgi:hypothetical protein
MPRANWSVHTTAGPGAAAASVWPSPRSAEPLGKLAIGEGPVAHYCSMVPPRVPQRQQRPHHTRRCHAFTPVTPALALAQGASCDSARACAVAYPCAVRQGLLFVKPQSLPNPRLDPAADAAAVAADVDTSDIPVVAELDTDEGWVSVVSESPGDILSLRRCKGFRGRLLRLRPPQPALCWWRLVGGFGGEHAPRRQAAPSVLQ